MKFLKKLLNCLFNEKPDYTSIDKLVFIENNNLGYIAKVWSQADLMKSKNPEIKNIIQNVKEIFKNDLPNEWKEAEHLLVLTITGNTDSKREKLIINFEVKFIITSAKFRPSSFKNYETSVYKKYSGELEDFLSKLLHNLNYSKPLEFKKKHLRTHWYFINTLIKLPIED